MVDEKPKEGIKTEKNNHINLKVVGQEGSPTMKDSFSMRQIRFLFERRPVSETDIPTQSEIEDKGKIDVF
ncbi:unnamed protein product [Nyctereutes procyonoides]|uniref:(raccoon dog) hypothetical protein n=1 Tax=Nyctereutes procyonoides TaxID=34880 RepID=A0A811ZP94_NYCPR|nr:unnamed protein product [Nyctereutes procyonoides]